MKSSCLAFAVTAVGTGALILACSGAETSDVLGAPGQATASSSGTSGAKADASSSGTGTSGNTSGGTSGTTSGGTSGTTSGGTSGEPTDACAAGCPAPPAGCSYPDPCDCTLKCPDAAPVTCDWKVAGSCPDGYFCDAVNCSNVGQCVKKPQVENVQRDPQCGCDGVTYWNTSVARTAGVPIKNKDQCGNDSAKCGGIVGSTCPGSASCNHPVKNKNQCTLPDASGTCWKLPAACPQIGGDNARAHSCNTNKCQGECDAIRSQDPWYDDGNCQ